MRSAKRVPQKQNLMLQNLRDLIFAAVDAAMDVALAMWVAMQWNPKSKIYFKFRILRFLTFHDTGSDSAANAG